MTKIDENLISKLEKLSRLRLSDTDREQIKGDLTRIVEMFDTLQEVDTEGVAPTRHMAKAQRLRDDMVQGELSKSEVLRNAPEQHDGHIAVPKFLDRPVKK